MAGERCASLAHQPVRPPVARFAAGAYTGESLELSDSITQLKTTLNIGVRLRTRVADGHGQARLEALTLEDVRTGQREQVPAAAVFVLIGAEAHTMAPQPRQAEQSWIRPDRPRRSPGCMAAAPTAPAV